MIERFIAPALTFIVLVAGHVAIASALINGPSAQAGEPALTARAAGHMVVKQAS
jgi:hypothetical protein